jgi:LysR family transcriptional regulator, transcriptional activator of the cysJI operon
MTVYQLKIFEAVSRHLNITQASLELHASQPAVSHQLKALEEDYGATFLVRQNHGVKLTDKGRAFLEAITPALAQLDDIDRRFKGNQNKNRPQSLAIGGSRTISMTVLPKLLKAFKDKHPSVEFTLTANDSSVVEKLLLKSELDLGVIANPSYTEGLIYEPFDHMEVVAVCLPSNPLAGKTLTLKELADYPLLVRSPSRLESVLVSQGYKMNFAVRCDASHPVKAAVRAGLGIGITYRNAIATALAKRSLKLVNVPELKEMEMKSVIAYDGRKLLSSIAQEFLALLRERAKQIAKIADRIRTLNGRERKLSKLRHVSTKTARKYA